MKEFEPFIPDPKLEAAKIAVVAEALEGGLYDRHLQFVDIADSPSSTIPKGDYGVRLTPMTHDAPIENMRPKREPMDWRTIATKTLGMDRDTPFIELATAIRQSHDGWVPYLKDRFDLSPEQVKSFVDVRRTAFRVGALTENNLSGYVQEISSVLVKARGAAKHSLDVLFAELSMWSGEEYGHSVAGDAYGEITDMIGDPLFTASRNSQLRAGSSEKPEDITRTKVYTSGQEGQTDTAHSKTAAIQEPVGHAINSAESKDESRHTQLFRSEVAELIPAFPDDTVRTIAKVYYHETLTMPGKIGIANFVRQAAKLAVAEMLTARDLHDNVRRCLGYWGIFGGTTRTGEVIDDMLKTDAAKHDLMLLREAYGTPLAETKQRSTKGFVLGKTLTIADLRTARKDYLSKIAA